MAASRKRTLTNFYRYYGEAMSAWADIEYTLAMWFADCLEADKNSVGFTAHRVFHSARSFHGSLDMLKAAFYGRRRSEGAVEFFRAAANRTESYYGFRNRLAHNLTVYNEPGDYAYIAAHDDPFAKKGKFTEAHLKAAITNFTKLQHIWLFSRPSCWPSPSPSLELSLQRINELPAEAHSNELGRKQRNRQRQRQLRPRSKKS